MTTTQEAMKGYKYLVAVRNPDTSKTEVYGFKAIENARLFMKELNKMKLDFIYTPKEETHE